MFRQETRALNGLRSAGWVRSLFAAGSVFVDPRWRNLYLTRARAHTTVARIERFVCRRLDVVATT